MLFLLKKISTVPNFARVSLIGLAIVVGMNLIATAFYTSQGGVGILDMRGGANVVDVRAGPLTPESAYAIIDAYGAEGIRYYLWIMVGDFVLPLAFAAFFTLATLLTVRNWPLSRGVLWFLLLSPFLYLTADYIENFTILSLLLAYPNRFPRLIYLLNMLTDFKFVMSNIAAGEIVLLLTIRILCVFFRKRKQYEW